MTVESSLKSKVADYLKGVFGGCKMRVKNPSGTVILDNMDITVNLSGTTILLHSEGTLQTSDTPATIEVYDSTSGDVYLTTTGSSQSAPAGSKIIVDWSVSIS